MNTEVTEIIPQWPDCKEVQCAQAHETLDAVLDLLGSEYSKDHYVIGKTITISEAIGELKAQVSILRREAFEARALLEAYKAKYNVA